MRTTAILTGLVISLSACLLAGCGNDDVPPLPEGFKTNIGGVQIEIMNGGEAGTQKVDKSDQGGKVVAGAVTLELTNRTAGKLGPEYTVMVNGKNYGTVTSGGDIVVGEKGEVQVTSIKPSDQAGGEPVMVSEVRQPK
jgi:hypothetical protein